VAWSFVVAWGTAFSHAHRLSAAGSALLDVVALATLAHVILLWYRSGIESGPTADAGQVALNARRRGLKTVVIGQDGRASTSKVQVMLWTGAVVWALIDLLLLARTYPGRSLFTAAVSGNWRLECLVLLGVPVVAAAIAKVAVSGSNGGKGPVKSSDPAVVPGPQAARVYVRDPVSAGAKGIIVGVAEVMTADDRTVAWADMQYVVFSLLTLVYFLVQVLAQPRHGLPAVLLTLIGVSASGYIAAKIVETRGEVPQEHREEPQSSSAPGGGGGRRSRMGRGGGRSRGEGRGLPALMDELLGSDLGAPLASAGPASAQVAGALASPETGQVFLAGMFWWMFTHSEAYRDVARKLSASRKTRPIVVGHADGTRFDLLLLDPRRRKRLAGIQLKGDQTSARLISSSLPRERLNSVLRRSGLGDSLETETLLTSAQELAGSSEFGVAIVNAPREIPTCALSPAVSLRSADNNPVATLGSFLTDTDMEHTDVCLATTAEHALGQRPRALVIDGFPLEVVRRHKSTDSCLVRVNRSILDGRQRNGLKGPLQGKAPRLYSRATFDGATSGPTPTRITAFMPEIFDPPPGEKCKVYTEADTAMGDSGAALIDEDDFIVGFAYQRSSYESPLQFSSWVWAEQVYMAHNLFTYVAIGA
jgi:hypothetical protein